MGLGEDLYSMSFSGMDRLQGASNYIIWAFKMKITMKCEGVRGVVKRRAGPAAESMVTSPSDVATQTNENEAETSTTQSTQLKEIESRKNRAMLLLAFAISDRVLFHIYKLSDPADVWERLEKLYKDAAIRRWSILKQNLYALKQSEGKPMKEHFKKVHSIIKGLALIGVGVDAGLDESELVMKIISSLPPSWSTFASTHYMILSAGKCHITFEEIEARILEEESRRNVIRSRGGSGPREVVELRLSTRTANIKLM